jgi:hypothetical protein
MSGISMASRAGALSRLTTPAAIRSGLLLYGVLLAGLSVHHFQATVPDQPVLMGTRVEGVERSIRTLESGGPPLLGCLNDYDKARPLEGCTPVGVTDDQGLYLYLPLLADAAGLDSPEEALKWFYILLFALLALVSPLVFSGLFGSLVAALFAPAAIVFHFDLFADTDIYWISGWCYLLAIPLLLLVYEKWGRYAPLLLAGVVAIGSFATSIRIHAGLPILLGALIVAILRRRSLVGLAATAAIVCLAYLSFAAVLTGVREYRDHAVGDPGLSERYPTRHPFWHNAYIGLGYLPNRYGIEWNDAISSEFVRQHDPSAGYLSKRYERILRDEYFRIAREDPGLVLRNVVAKLGLTLDAARDRFGIVLLLTPLALFIGPTRRWRRYLLIASPALLLSLPPPLLTMPFLQYQLGWLAAWGALWLLLACWAITVLPGEIRSHGGAWLETVRRDPLAGTVRGARRLLRSPAPWLALVLIATVSLFADVLGPRAARAVTVEDLWRERASALHTPARGDWLARWEFAGTLAPEWGAGTGTSMATADDAVEVSTPVGRFEYQLTGPVAVLSQGKYELRADATVAEGGLELGVLDADEDTWLSTAHYWYGQPGFGSHDLVVPFELTKPLRVRPILANWSPRTGTSRWLVRRIWIRRT